METGSSATTDNKLRGNSCTRPFTRACRIVLAAALMAAPMMAAVGAQEAKLAVSATVLKHASMKVLAQPSSVVVTPADIARGYVDVPIASHILVLCNTQQGFMLDFASSGDGIRQILVRGLGADVQLGPDGGSVAQRVSGRGMTRTSLDLGYRFVLSEAAQPGAQPWPMRLSVTPL
jgi:hypothetical protein